MFLKDLIHKKSKYDEIKSNNYLFIRWNLLYGLD